MSVNDDIDRALKSLTEVSPSPALRAKIMNRLGEAPAASLHGWRLAFLPVALVVIAAAIWIAFRPAPPRPTAQRQAHDVTLPRDLQRAPVGPELPFDSLRTTVERQPNGLAQGAPVGARRAQATTDVAPPGAESATSDSTATEPAEEPSSIPPIELPPIQMPPAAVMAPVVVNPIQIPDIQIVPLDDRPDKDRPPPGGTEKRRP